MSVDQLNKWLTLAANVGVIFGLVLVALQTRQNTTAIRATVHQQEVEYGRDNEMIWLTNPTLAALKRRGESDPAALSPEELETFYTLVTWNFATWETVWINREAGLVDEARWKPWNEWYTAVFVSKPGYRAWWRDNRHAYIEGFQQHLDGILAQPSKIPNSIAQ